MKKASIFLVSISLFTSTFTATAAVKAGASCNKAGATSTISGKKFTCIKSGKKLVWDKGVVIKSLAPTPITTPSPTPTPAAKTISAGDECSLIGSDLNVGAQSLKCLQVINLKSIWIDYTNKNADLTNQGFSTEFSKCRIPDSRVQKIQTEAIAYPVTPRDPNFTSTSTITTAIIPIDFPDVPGNVDPTIFAKQIQDETDQWNRWFTRGKSKINWIIYPNWIRANKNSSEFNWIHPQSMTAQVQDNSIEVGQNLISLAETKIDLKGIQDLLFVYPKDANKIQDSINYSRGMSTRNGQQLLGMYATSAWSYRDQESLAMWLIHENMHRFGFAGHSPAWPPLFSVAHNQAGLSRVMNIWDRIALDWINPGDIYCTDLTNAKEETITLVPQEREQSGIQGVAIQLSSHELLIMESHKKDKWSQNYPSEFYGVTMMYVDTTRDTDRSGENFGDDYKGTKFSRTATYVDLHSLNHAPASFGSISDGVNYMLRQGESFEFKGVKVEFLTAGYNDTIKISKTP